jgi:hypothetical protein
MTAYELFIEFKIESIPLLLYSHITEYHIRMELIRRKVACFNESTAKSV